MSKSVRCIIIGCDSNAFTDMDVKFFKFPSPDDRAFKTWLNICHGSAKSILKHPRPYICSKHFRGGKVGFRRLAYNAFPSLNLNNPPRCIIEQRRIEDTNLTDLTEEQQEKRHLVKLLNETVRKWARRSRFYSYTSVSKSEVIRVATKVRSMLGPKVTLSLDNYWYKKFRSRLNESEPYEKSVKTVLDLEQIIKELDPNVKIYTEAETQSLENLELKNIFSVEPRVSEIPSEEGDVSVSHCEVDGDGIGPPKFSGRRYVKKSKAYDENKVGIGDKCISTKDLSMKCNGSDLNSETIISCTAVDRCENTEEVCDNYRTKPVTQFIEDSNDVSHPNSETITSYMKADESPAEECNRYATRRIIQFIDYWNEENNTKHPTLHSTSTKTAVSNSNTEASTSFAEFVEDPLKENTKNYPLQAVKSEAMDVDSVPLYNNRNVEFANNCVKVEVSDSDDKLSLITGIEVQSNDGKQTCNTLSGIKMEIDIDGKAIVQSDCNINRVFDNFNTETLSENENVTEPESEFDSGLGQSHNDRFLEDQEIFQPECRLDEIPYNVTDNKIISQSDCSVSRISENINGDKSLEADMVQPESFPDKAPNDHGIINENLPNAKKGFLDDYLKYIHLYNKPKPKLRVPTNTSQLVKQNNINPRCHNHSASKKKPHKKDETLLKNVKDFYRSGWHPVIFTSKTVDPPRIPVRAIERVDPKKTSKNNTYPDCDPLLEIEPEKDETDQLSEIPLNEAIPCDNHVLKVRPLCMYGYWSSDDSSCDERSQKKITSYIGALEYLKPLEDFVLRKEDYRAIGLVTNIEIHFKNRARLRQEQL